MFRKTLTAVLLLPVAGCYYSSDDSDEVDPYLVETPVPLVSAAVQTDSTLSDIVPGRETGLFVEYSAGGQWHVYAICDYLESHYPCEWDVFAYPRDRMVHDLATEDHEIEDYAGVDRDWSYVQLQVSTTTGQDGVWITATPGEGLVLDVRLDGAPAPDFVYWVSDGAVNPGAPDNPLELVPTEP